MVLTYVRLYIYVLRYWRSYIRTYYIYTYMYKYVCTCACYHIYICTYVRTCRITYMYVLVTTFATILLQTYLDRIRWSDRVVCKQRVVQWYRLIECSQCCQASNLFLIRRWRSWRCGGGHIANRYVSRLNTAEINPPQSKKICKGFALFANGYCNVSNNALENSN